MTSHSTDGPGAIMRGIALVLALAVSGSLIWIATDSPGDRFGPMVAAVTAGVWFLAIGGRVLWTRSSRRPALLGGVSFHALDLLILVTSSVYTLLALQEADVQRLPSPDQPDFVPGLFTDLSVYYLAMHAAVVAFVALYGHTRGRALETAVMVQVVLLAPLYEPVLQLDMGAPLMLGPVLVLAASALAQRGNEDVSSFRWTPFGPPLLAFLVAGLVVTATAAYVQHSLIVLAKVGALTGLVFLLFQIVRSQRQVWLVWAAVVLPVTWMAIVQLAKLFEIGNNMDVEFAIRLRFLFIGLIGANTIGLAFTVNVLLIIGALFWTRRSDVRAVLLAMLVPSVLCLLSVRSSAGLVALGVGLFVLVVTAAKPGILRDARAFLTKPVVAAGVVALAVAVVAMVVLPNPYRSEWRDEVSDPTTGRGVRENMWRWVVEDIQANPVVGIGLNDRRFEARAQHVPEFPFRDVTQLIERRLLLGGDGTEWRVFVWAQPHNVLLLVTESMGLVGLVPFAWLCLVMVWCGITLILRPMTRDRWTMAVCLACIGGALAWSFFALGQNVAYLPLTTWALLGLLGGAYVMANESLAAPAGLGERLAAWSKGMDARLVKARPLVAPALMAVVVIAFLGMVARPVAADAFYQRANDARLDGDFDSAIDEIKIARRLDPNSADYADFLGQSYFRTLQEEKERSTLERLVELDPESAKVHARIAWTYWYQGDFPQALEELERSVELDPWDSIGSSNVYSLALAYQFAERRQDAIDTFQRAFYLNPAIVNEGAWYPVDNPAFGDDLILDPAYASDLSNARLQTLLNQRVYGLFTNAEPPDLPVSAEQTLYLSDVLEDGYRDAQVLRTNDPERANGMLSALARTYSRAGLHERAAEISQELSAELPDRSYVFYDLGREYAALNRDDDARAAFEKALAISNASSAYDIYEPFIIYQTGLLDAKAGDYEAALERFRETLDEYRWPYFPQAYESLADAARRTGNTEEADSTMRKLRYLLGDEYERQATAG